MLKMDINDYAEKHITHNGRTHVQEWFSDCKTIEDAANAIIGEAPLPDGLSVDDVIDYIKDDWKELKIVAVSPEGYLYGTGETREEALENAKKNWNEKWGGQACSPQAWG